MRGVYVVVLVFSWFFFGHLSEGFSQSAKGAEEEVVTDKDSTSNQKNKYKELLEKGTWSNGLFNVIRQKGDYFFEVSDSLMGVDLLLVNKISSVPYALNGHGLNKGMAYESKMIRFYKDTALNKVWVKTINPRVSSPANDAITLSVKENFVESVIESFDIEAKNEDSTTVVIKVNKIFDGNRKSFTDLLASTGLGGGIQTDLSKIEDIKAFPENIVVKSLLTTSVSEGGPALPLSIGITLNIVLLPKNPMMPRYADKRIGYFDKPISYFSDEQHEIENREMITRWRLEPKEEDEEKYLSGELVEPKQPIIYYIDPSTPPQWRTYIQQGVLDWNEAFEEAGFKHAVQAKEVTDEEDFDIDDVRYSVITYAASAQKNAMGPSIIDPRSGEIIEADIMWWHNVMKAVHMWMRVQTGTIDPKARANKFSDAHMGEAIRFVSSHEVGHTFGLTHNMGASHSYPVDSLRSPSFTSHMSGTAPSIMDYARYNYVAQPGDHVTEITPEIGIYDKYAIHWGYRWLGLSDPHDETAQLNDWIRAHENDPLYFYGPQQPDIIDPRSQSEDLGDDAVKASMYGLQNLKKIVPNILSWAAEVDQDYYQAAKLYKGVIDQWVTYNGHVVSNLGGVYINNTVAGDKKESYVPVPALKQREAVNYLIENGVKPQHWLFTPDLIHKVYAVRDAPDGERYYSPVSLMRTYQTNVMYAMVKTDRLARIIDNQVLVKGGEEVFTAHDIYDPLFEAVFQKTEKGKDLDMYDRMTQKNYVDVLTVDRLELLKKTKENALTDDHREFKNIHYTYIPRVSDIGSIQHAELQRILKLLKKKRKSGDRDTRAHYEDLISRIEFNLKN
ncbi:metalloprotease [Reichenbachiella sp. 5M10]|uniref:zinc-dependent metalloprotease n=1 Tax=Reichenbachiella sp. 5M10 TaxID=1889772 RepID=UPI000C14A04B|nr:zinc-dependent metalloprotease [Reichenbachiella sp. 5M10]PIB36005.1 metalloprotease [Reichenbachiella sp. 5M10]